MDLRSSQRVPELDGIRGLAILLVLVWHYLVSALRAAPATPLAYIQKATWLSWSGVDLFFVLRGFLIGGILMDNRNARNYFRVFYIRAPAAKHRRLDQERLGRDGVGDHVEPRGRRAVLRDVSPVGLADRQRKIPYVLVSLISVAPIIRVVLFHMSANDDEAFQATYTLLPCRMDALLLGSLCAWVVRYRPGLIKTEWL